MRNEDPKTGRGDFNAVGFEVTDTVLLEIDAQLAEMAASGTAEPADFDMDFDAALKG